MIVAAPTTPVTCVRAPLWNATAVRDPLVLTGNPWKNPAAMLAAPTPIISRSPSTSSPVRAAKADAVEMVSVEGDQGYPERAGEQEPQVAERHGRKGEGREPLGSVADQVDAPAGEVERADGRDRQDDGDEHGREGRPQALETEDQRQARDADRQRRADGLAVADAADERARLADQAVRVDGEPEQLGQLADEDGEREAVHVPDLRRLRQQVGDEARA